MRTLLTLVVLATGPNAGELAPKLEAVLRAAPSDALVSVIVQTARQGDLSTLPGTSSYDDKVHYLRAVARDARQDLLNRLTALDVEGVKPFWLVSRVALRATRAIILELAARDDVGMVWFDDTVRLADLRLPSAPAEALDTELWNIARVKADSCWAGGYTGAGVVVGNIDTGVEVTHPAFGGRWRATNGWFDAVNGLPTPYDDHGLSHGTFTMGILTGGDGPGPYTPDIGVAPGATFICAKGLPGAGGGTIGMVEAALNWMADPGRPDVLSNSYGLGPGADTFHFGSIQRLRDLGMIVVFSAGNDGPGPGTISMPSSLPVVFSVGATSKLDVVENFSSRGPAPDAWPWNDPHYWLRGDWERVCPSVSAPGSKVVSAVRGGGFDTSLGTSVAGPHVAGCAALLKQKYPTLTQDQAMHIIPSTADPVGTEPLPNNDFGWGRLNCLRALAAALPRDLPYIKLDTFRVADEGNHNDTLERGEDGSIVVLLQNTGRLPATNLCGVLRGDEPNFTVLESTATFGTLGVADTANNAAAPFRIRVSPTCPLGYPGRLPLVLTSAETSWTRFIDITIGAAGTGLWGPKELVGLPGSTSRALASGVAYNPVDDRLYVTCEQTSLVHIYSSDSLVELVDSIWAPDSNWSCYDLAFCPSDTTFWVLSYYINAARVSKLRPDGTVLRRFVSPATTWPTGIAWDGDAQRLYQVENQYDPPSLVHVTDTLGNALDTIPIPLGYNSGAKCLTREVTRGNPYRPALVNAYEFYNAGGGVIDSAGIYMLRSDIGAVVSRFLVRPPDSGYYPFRISGVEYDPRDASYWVTFDSRSAPFHKIAKYSGFYPVAVREETGSLPLADGLRLRCRPNPCRDFVNLSLGLTGASRVRMQVFDRSGREVTVPGTRELPSGNTVWQLDTRGLVSGVYFVRLDADGAESLTRLVVLR